MSKSTKRKYVTREVVEDYVEPEGEQEIVKVRAGSYSPGLYNVHITYI